MFVFDDQNLQKFSNNQLDGFLKVYELREDSVPSLNYCSQNKLINWLKRLCLSTLTFRRITLIQFSVIVEQILCLDLISSIKICIFSSTNYKHTVDTLHYNLIVTYTQGLFFNFEDFEKLFLGNFRNFSRNRFLKIVSALHCATS